MLKAMIAVEDHFNLLERAELGQPRRISLTNAMCWGAMLLGVYIASTAVISATDPSVTEAVMTGLVSLVAAGLKFAKDTRRDQ